MTTDHPVPLTEASDATLSPALRARVNALVTLSRPRQWTKNVLVLAAPLAAGRIGEIATLRTALLAMLAFTLMASGVYWINDAMDVSRDRLHPTKRHRPIAAGTVPVRAALVGGFALQTVALLVAWLTVNPVFAGVLAAYALLQLAYNVRLKHVPVAELLVVASGFVMRALAGGVATGIVLTEWFLIVASFGALFAVAGKRYAESLAMGDLAGEHRKVLDAYPPAFLQQVVGVCLAVTLLAYCLWAFRTATLVTAPSIWLALSVIPVTLIALRYLLLVAAGRTGEPEELLLRDRVISIGALATAVMVLFGLYG